MPGMRAMRDAACIFDSEELINTINELYCRSKHSCPTVHKDRIEHATVIHGAAVYYQYMHNTPIQIGNQAKLCLLCVYGELTVCKIKLVLPNRFSFHLIFIFILKHRGSHRGHTAPGILPTGARNTKIITSS